MEPAKTLFVLASLFSGAFLAASPNSPIITAVAGDGKDGFSGDGGAAISAQLFNPHGIALDALGNLYIADTDNKRIRKVSATGVISTVAGTGIEGFRKTWNPTAFGGGDVLKALP